MSEIPISNVAKSEVSSAKRIINSIEGGRRGSDTGAWFEAGGNAEAVLDFRVPNADHKHPSSISVNIHATDPHKVFSAGKYSAIRFETLGQRAPTEEKLERLYGQGEDRTVRELREEHEKVIDERERAFDEIAHECAESFRGIRLYTDTGDGAFSGNDYRPHVRLQRLNTDGESLGRFIEMLVNQLEDFYADLPHDRFVHS